MENRYFRKKILDFYKQNKRKFFWRTEDLEPFQVMTTELFLKKTKAETVEKYMHTFIKKYNSNIKLREAKESEIFNKISRLGLGKQRTRALKEISSYIHENFNDNLPDKAENLLEIPHVGLYVTNATICFGFNKRSPILDVNTSRIISRFFNIDNNKDLRDNKELQDMVKKLLPRKNFKEYNWGLLDLGALVCKTKPLCDKCPLVKKCIFYQNSVKSKSDIENLYVNSNIKYNMMEQHTFTYIDIFAGCGGLSLGLYKSGWHGLFAIEKSPLAFETLKHNLIDKKKHFKWPAWLPKTPHDINEVLVNYEKELEKLRGKVDLVVGGPPCQGFSLAGRRNEADSRNKLIDSYIKFISLVNPKMLFFENVKGFTIGFKKKNSRGTAYSNYVVEELKKLGYEVEGRIIDFSEFGVPQRRKRFILVGLKAGDPCKFFDLIIRIKVSFLKKKGLNVNNSVKCAISDLERVNGEVSSISYRGFKEGVYSEPMNNYQKYLRKDCNYNLPDSHRFANHTRKTIEKFNHILENCSRNEAINESTKRIFELKKKCTIPLDMNQKSPTLTTLPDDYIHYSEPRILTVREYARIQTFDDWFEIRGKYTTGGKLRRVEVPRYTQVGNAIPPLFGELAGNILKGLL
ncbi:MAG: DNA (cytosine-5-)-methyltransferase [Halobacteriota archaeon]